MLSNYPSNNNRYAILADLIESISNDDASSISSSPPGSPTLIPFHSSNRYSVLADLIEGSASSDNDSNSSTPPSPTDSVFNIPRKCVERYLPKELAIASTAPLHRSKMYSEDITHDFLASTGALQCFDVKTGEVVTDEYSISTPSSTVGDSCDGSEGDFEDESDDVDRDANGDERGVERDIGDDVDREGVAASFSGLKSKSYTSQYFYYSRYSSEHKEGETTPLSACFHAKEAASKFSFETVGGCEPPSYPDSDLEDATQKVRVNPRHARIPISLGIRQPVPTHIAANPDIVKELHDQNDPDESDSDTDGQETYYTPFQTPLKSGFRAGFQSSVQPTFAAYQNITPRRSYYPIKPSNNPLLTPRHVHFEFEPKPRVFSVMPSSTYDCTLPHSSPLGGKFPGSYLSPAPHSIGSSSSSAFHLTPPEKTVMDALHLGVEERRNVGYDMYVGGSTGDVKAKGKEREEGKVVRGADGLEPKGGMMMFLFFFALGFMVTSF